VTDTTDECGGPLAGVEAVTDYLPDTLPAIPPGGVTCGIDWANDNHLPAQQESAIRRYADVLERHVQQLDLSCRRGRMTTESTTAGRETVLS
jgi:hypothetical protein